MADSREIRDERLRGASEALDSAVVTDRPRAELDLNPGLLL